MNAQDNSTTIEKLTVAFTAFGFACAGLALGAIIFVPVLGTILGRIGASELLTQMTILLSLFGTPVVASLLGIRVAAQPIIQRQQSLN